MGGNLVGYNEGREVAWAFRQSGMWSEKFQYKDSYKIYVYESEEEPMRFVEEVSGEDIEYVKKQLARAITLSFLL